MENKDTFLSSLLAYSTIWVGYSGGVDSTVLLHWIAKHPLLFPRVRAIHVHHGLSANADTWLSFCKHYTHQLNIPFVFEKVQVNQDRNIEASARESRYAVYEKYVQPTDILLLGHHLDDQIETFFLNLLRGSGVDGLSVMPMMKIHQGMRVARPLLNDTRLDILNYASLHQLSWIDDESNDNTHFSRNFLRHEILPKIEQNWPHYRKSMLKTFSICQQSQISIEDQAYTNYPDLLNRPDQLDRQLLRTLSAFHVSIILRTWLKQKNFATPRYEVMNEIYEQMILSYRQDAMPIIRWANIELHVYQDKLFVFETSLYAHQNQSWIDFPNPLILHSSIKLNATLESQGFKFEPHRDEVEVRFRKGGEKFYWRGHHRCLKKLFQAWKVPPFLRAKIPLVYVNGILKQVVGYACDFETSSSNSLYQVRITP